MNEDPRCCGSGTCIIDAEGVCWCGQRWDGQAMRIQRSPAAAPANGATATGVDAASSAHQADRRSPETP
jgi:hypothetical protein